MASRRISLPTLCFIIFLFLTSLILPSFAKDPLLSSSATINRSLSGSRTGVLTKSEGAVLHIDRMTYTLAPQALVEDKFGTPLTPNDTRWNDVEFRVQYWLAPDLGPNLIRQLIVTLPQ
jgi:hypothetical protein